MMPIFADVSLISEENSEDYETLRSICYRQWKVTLEICFRDWTERKGLSIRYFAYHPNIVEAARKAFEDFMNSRGPRESLAIYDAHHNDVSFGMKDLTWDRIVWRTYFESEEMTDFWNQILTEKKGRGSLFTGPLLSAVSPRLEQSNHSQE